MAKNERYIGGGVLEYQDAEGNWIKIGAVQSLKVNVNTETKEAYDFSTGLKEVVDEVIVKKDYTLKFDTSDSTSSAMLKAAFSGKSAVANGVETIEAGTGEQLSAPLRFTAKYTEEPLSVAFFNVKLKLEGDWDLIAEDFTKLSFSGKCLRDADNAPFKIIKGTPTTTGATNA